MRSGAADKEETFRKKAVPHRGNKYRVVTDPENKRHAGPKGLGAYDLDMAYGLTKGPRRPTEAELLARDNNSEFFRNLDTMRDRRWYTGLSC